MPLNPPWKDLYRVVDPMKSPYKDLTGRKGSQVLLNSPWRGLIGQKGFVDPLKSPLERIYGGKGLWIPLNAPCRDLIGEKGVVDPLKPPPRRAFIGKTSLQPPPTPLKLDFSHKPLGTAAGGLFPVPFPPIFSP